jgi:hypothetical protein
MRMYAAERQPVFAQFLSSDVVSLQQGRNGSTPVEVTLSVDTLERLEEIEVPSTLPAKKAHVATIDGKRYVIDQYYITAPDGNRLERGQDGASVSLRKVVRV